MGNSPSAPLQSLFHSKHLDEIDLPSFVLTRNSEQIVEYLVKSRGDIVPDGAEWWTTMTRLRPIQRTLTKVNEISTLHSKFVHSKHTENALDLTTGDMENQLKTNYKWKIVRIK